MIKVENIDVWGFEHAIRGMRNPYDSWNKSDSEFKGFTGHDVIPILRVGKNDLGLMQKLYKGGPEHRKYLRQIMVSMDITAPLYWWKEFDTYKVGTVANSCSTMHTIHKKEFSIDDFSHEHLEGLALNNLQKVVDVLNISRMNYLHGKSKQDWWQMIQLLPSSYDQKRTVTMNYENVVTMIRQRTGHRLDEWNEFIDILKNLEYIKEIISADSH